MKSMWLLLCAALLLAACGGRHPSAAELQQKIDSVRTLEQVRQLRLEGIDAVDGNPIKTFYDSLACQALPLSYTDDYVAALPSYRVVPLAIMVYLELEGRESPLAIALPEAPGCRLILVAADLDDGAYELWLYSLDDSYMPVDKLLLYQPQLQSATNLGQPVQETFFSITTNYEVSILEYTDASDLRGQLSTFVLDESRMFVEKPISP